MRITLLSGVQCTPDRGRVVNVDSHGFLNWLGDRERCPSTECASTADKLAGDGFVFAQYVEGATTKNASELEPESSTDLLCYDVDNIDLHAFKRALTVWGRVDAVLYSTRNHTTEHPKVRVVVRLSRPITGVAFRQVYTAGAWALQIPYDKQAADRGRFFLAPQHKPGANGSVERIRFAGEPLDVDGLLAVKVPTEDGVHAVAPGVGDFDAPLARPALPTIRALAKKLSGSWTEREQKIGSTLDAVLRGGSFAHTGEVHTAMTQLAFELARKFPRIDAEWFADEHLIQSWASMWPGEDADDAAADWIKCVETAESKLARGREEARADAVTYMPEAAVDMTPAELGRVSAVAGGLVCEHRGNFYVYDPRMDGAGGYVGPLKGTGLSAAAKRCLVGVPGFSYQIMRENSPPALKSGAVLCEQYGVDLQSVHYHAIVPEGGRVFDREKRLVHIGAYQWNHFEAVHHPIVEEMFRAVFGDQYERAIIVLHKWRDLGQSLPAMALVGDRGTWKSRLSQTLSRFWGTPDAPSPCDASQVLNRFSGPLAYNPVIWSDEQMATSETGKPIPEAYRRSITEKVHSVERKGVDPVMLHTATRHVISVNDVDKIFGGEIDAASVEATIERFLISETDAVAVSAMEANWARTPELDRMREGTSILEHVRWLEENTSPVSEGRLFVRTDTNPEVLLRARFSDDTLATCMAIAIEALLKEGEHSAPGQLNRLPLVMDETGQLRLSPQRIVDLWPDSKLTAGLKIGKPTVQKVGQMLAKAGFKMDLKERATKNKKWKAWKVDHARLKEFLHVNESYDWDDIVGQCKRVFGAVSLRPDYSDGGP